MRKWLAFASLLLLGAAPDWRAGPPPETCPTTGTVILTVLTNEEAKKICTVMVGRPSIACYQNGKIIMGNKAPRWTLPHEMCHYNGGTHG